jgi:hypothetical protein
MADLVLGAVLDPTSGERTDRPAQVSTGELTTHGVIVGMTGSGKTGLGVVLIEEVLSAGVPVLLIDPKGDLTNLALVFPELRGSDFRPWVDESAAGQAGLDLDAFAEQQATTWREGLSGWGVGPERLQALRDSVEVTVYTPGSAAGRPLNVVGSLHAPPPGTDAETISDEIDGYVTSLLGMLGISGDPLSSREHILLANLIQNSWAQGVDLDLATLLAQVQQPPLRKLGVIELDAFFPPADRVAFAMRINGLLASPSFAAWMQGDPIDIESMLRTPDGRARCAVVTTAHLSDEQRQSVTSLVLGKLVTWMRRQTGTTDLRAMLYMDEVAGYLPPTANPPTKKPIMLLLKQARAFGLGVVLSTQNPVDVDYKALSNAGTWMIGRLQTEQDKARLVDGLSSATGGVDVASVTTTISGLGKRQFLLRRSGVNEPAVITSRWAMSYLRGPMTRDQIATLSQTAAATPDEPAPAAAPAVTTAPTTAPDPVAPAAEPIAAAPPVAPAPAPVPPPAAAPAGAALGDDETPVMPTVPVPTSHVDPAAPWLPSVGAAATGRRLRGAAIARVQLRYDDEKAGVVHDEEYEAVLAELPAIPSAAGFVAVDYDDRDLAAPAPAGAAYVLLPSEATSKTYWTTLRKLLIDELVRTRTTEVAANTSLKLYGRVGESAEEFLARCHAAADTAAEKELAALRTKYETRLAAARAKISDAQVTAQISQQEYEAEYGVAATVTSALGSLLGGRRSRSSLAAQAKRERAASAKVGSTAAKVDAAGRAYADLEARLQEEILAIDAEWDAKAADITTRPIPLEKSDVSVVDLRLAWLPVD